MDIDSDYSGERQGFSSSLQQEEPVIKKSENLGSASDLSPSHWQKFLNILSASIIRLD